MTHRADRVVEAAVAAIRNYAPSGLSVHAHRRLTLTEHADELPAVTVDYGEDQPAPSPGLIDGTIHSLLTLNVTGIATSESEEGLRRYLLDIRSLVHASLNAWQGLSLDFVIGAPQYGGALPPNVDVSGAFAVGELTSQWGILYEMEQHSAE